MENSQRLTETPFHLLNGNLIPVFPSTATPASTSHQFLPGKYLVIVDVSKKNGPLLCLCQAWYIWPLTQPTIRNQIMKCWRDEQPCEIKRTKRAREKDPFTVFCLWVCSIATTAYGHQAVASLRSDVRLIVQCFPQRILAGLLCEGLTSL